MLNSSRANWLAGLVLLLGVWWLPWWAWGALWLVTILLLTKFYQALVPAFLFDLSYIPVQGWWQIALPLTIATLILLWLAGELQYRLRL